MARRYKIAFAILGFVLAAIADYGVTVALENLGVNEGDAELAGNVVFALAWIIALWLVMRPRRRRAA